MSELLAFFKKHADADIFCLQEIWNGGEEMLGEKSDFELAKRNTRLLQDIEEALPDHRVYFRPHFSDYYGLAMYVRKELAVEEEGEIYVYKEAGFISPDEYGNHARNLQYITVLTSGGPLTIMNVHGLWNGQGKADCAERLEQSDRIVNFVTSRKEQIILMGDFNLRPDTESVSRIEAAGLRNLIKEYGVTSTRTSHYTKPEKFADYTFVSGEIEVKDFKVLPDEVSDHAPLYLEFD